ncbi:MULTISPECIES: hypothetical protein [Thalassospira]|uniref:Uncharacterized protein n=2 Tax=Thalassospira TaxID=168934 RepID=A0A367WF83_9PROT|nr:MULTISPECIES: hypothetical protein [Thalassospira]MDG4718947.1 hypothetical protein [Thalassospira sp. FZY0004]RCK39909.1 hypothetical protein TH19_02395 [Thalassospira profundimaris]
MKIERFEELLDQYGWDLGSWPDSLRREANVLLAQDAHAAELLRSLRSVEDLLADDPLPMGKHKAIDDIFAAIEAEENKASSVSQAEASDPNQSFQSIDDRPRSRAHLTVASAAPLGEGPARKTYPTQSTKSPVNPAIATDAAHYNGRAKGVLHLLGRRMFSGVGMAACALAGFVFGVVMTIEEGQQVNAHADEIEVIDFLENHLYVIDQVTVPKDGQDTAVPNSVSGQGVSAQ